MFRCCGDLMGYRCHVRAYDWRQRIDCANVLFFSTIKTPSRSWIFIIGKRASCQVTWLIISKLFFKTWHFMTLLCKFQIIGSVSVVFFSQWTLWVLHCWVDYCCENCIVWSYRCFSMYMFWIDFNCSVPLPHLHIHYTDNKRAGMEQPEVELGHRIWHNFWLVYHVKFALIIQICLDLIWGGWDKHKTCAFVYFCNNDSSRGRARVHRTWTTEWSQITRIITNLLSPG